MDKRTWTNEEAEALVGFMEKSVIEGHRVDAGQFKPGAFDKLASKMNAKFLGCGLTAKHCKNKHKRLKKKYQSAADMLACSGFGWNEEKKMVGVDSKQVLDIWLKQHPTRFYSPGRSFPLFLRLETIFGKDRATGGYAVSGNDADEQLEEDDDQQMGINDFEMFETDSPMQPNTSIASSSCRTQGKTGSYRKGKDIDILKDLAATIRYAMEQQGQHVQVLAKAIVGVNDETKPGETLGGLGFIDDEVVLAGLKLLENTQYVLTFWSFNDNQRHAFVRAIIHN